jgi:23S rRNA (cytosine1962-C5)-methyltransferase
VFARWVRGEPASLGDERELARAIEDAAVLRSPLAAVTDAYRLVNELGDGLPGVTIDRYGDFAVLVSTSDEAARRAPELAEALLELGARGVYSKLRRKLDARRADATLAPETPLAGEPAPERLVVTERGAKFWVEVGRGLSTGLFVDQRENRRRVRELADGARVVNLFAYTSSFGVAAALGGAREVVSVDTSAPALARARDNFALNGVADGGHRFEHADALDWLARAARRGERFDLVVLDPPTFSSSAGGAPFTVGEHYATAVTRALGVLAPGGRLFAVTNHRKTSRGRLREIVRCAAKDAGVAVAQLKDLPAALDCPDGPDGPTPSKSVLLTRR